MANPDATTTTLRAYHPILPIFLRLLALVLFFYWGLTHLIHPEWYLAKFMGIEQFDHLDTYDLWSANLLGIMNVAFAIAIWRAASDPAKYQILIDMILMVSGGTLAVLVFFLLKKDLSPKEWYNVWLIAGSIIVLFLLYPKSHHVIKPVKEKIEVTTSGD